MQCTTLEQKIELLNKPYLKSGEIARLLDRSPSTASEILKKNEGKIFYMKGWGYLTDDIIKVFKLDRYVKRVKK